jgi:hypothetical protein
VSVDRFARVTLVSVTGLSDARSAAYALTQSAAAMPGARALLCSPNPPPDLHPGIRHCPIAPLNYAEYSWFMMFALWRLIETDYALIVQDDGWVLDGANWRDEYFDYDYIGALSHHARVDTPEGMRWMSRWGWHEASKLPGHVARPLLNGGFCLRSRRMMRALVDHPEIQVVIPPPDVVAGNPLQMTWYSGATTEDEQLTMILRPQLEAVGIRYAPFDVCQQFSMEDLGPMYQHADFMQLFGFHNRWRRLVRMHPPTIRYMVTQREIDRVPREGEMIDMLTARGYAVECRLEAPTAA